MNRTRLLPIAAAVLLAVAVAHHLWKNWGLMTIHAADRPLGEVIREVEGKGRIHIQTNLDPAKKITLHVIDAPLAYVLEVLGSVCEARCQVAYVLAPSKSEIDQALAAVAAGNKPEGWKSWHLEMRGGFNADAAPRDARHERWEVKRPEEAALHAYLEQASINVPARFTAPAAWNPPIAAPPASGPLDGVVPKLAKAAGGEFAEVVMLMGRRRDTADAGGEDRESVRGLFSSESGKGDPDPEKERGKRAAAYEQRIEAEIARLPAGEQARARAEHAERKAFYDSVKDLPSEERRAKFEDRMSQPENAERMSSGLARRDAMRTPEQRADRYRSYVNNKRAATGQ